MENIRIMFDDKNTIIINNNAIHPIINRIELKKFTDSTFAIIIYIKNETSEQRQQLLAIPGVEQRHQRSGYKSILSQSADTIKSLIHVIHSIDPLPLSVFHELSTFGIDMPEYACAPLAKAIKGDVDGALMEALKGDAKNYPEKLAKLINYYQEQSQFENWLKVTTAVPRSSSIFQSVNEQLLNYYNTIQESTPELLTLRFKHAYFAGLDEANLYYSELCGHAPLQRLITLTPGGNADDLINLAHIMREMNTKITKLEATKPSALNTTRVATPTSTTQFSIFSVEKVEPEQQGNDESSDLSKK